MSQAPNKLLSILIPSRGRFDKLIDCLETFRRQLTAEQLTAVEFIVKFDSDDDEALRRIPELPFQRVDLQLYIADKQRGYCDLYLFYNQCARLAKGRFLMMWNDDARFRTPDWFQLFVQEVRNAKGAASYWFGGTPTLVSSPGDAAMRQEDWPCFIAHHRALYEIIGFYSDIGGVDSFLYYVLGPLGLLHKIPAIEVDHLAWFQIPEAQRDRTARENGEEGQMLPTNFEVVTACQEKIKAFAARQAQQSVVPR